MREYLLRRIVFIVSIVSFVMIAFAPAMTGGGLKTVEIKKYSLSSDKYNFTDPSEIFHGSVNMVDFGRIIGTKVKWFLFLFFPDSYVVEKHVNVSDWDPECEKCVIAMSAEPFGSRFLRFIVYNLEIRIKDICEEKEVIVGLEEIEFYFPLILEDIGEGETINVSISLRGGVVLPILRVPFFWDRCPENNDKICSFKVYYE